MSRIVGIDFGTTKSIASIVENGQPIVIGSAEGSGVLPSVVSFDHNGEPLVGGPAKNQAALNPENTIHSIKRLVGERYHPILKERGISYSGIVPGPNGEALLHIPATGQDYAPHRVAAMILAKLKTEAESYLGEPVTQAVVSVPGCSSLRYKLAIKEAGKLAGLDIVRVITEPGAAILSSSTNKNIRYENIVVFDLGGGKMDASVLLASFPDGVFQVKSMCGNPFLGGDDWDQRIIREAVNGFRNSNHIDLSQDPAALERLREAAEKAKIELSTQQQTILQLPNITAKSGGSQNLAMRLTRARFEGITADLAAQCQAQLDKAIREAGLRPDQVEMAILNGGSSNMPMIQRLLGGYFRNKTTKLILGRRDSVAKGAAMFAGILEGRIRDVLLLNITPMPLGIESNDGSMLTVLEKNCTIPVRKSITLPLAEKEQKDVTIHILEGEHPTAEKNFSIGHIRFEDLLPEPTFLSGLIVIFEIDATGMLRVTVRHLESGNSQTKLVDQYMP